MLTMTPIPITLGVGDTGHRVGHVALSASHDQPAPDVLRMRLHARIEFDPAFAAFVTDRVAPDSAG